MAETSQIAIFTSKTKTTGMKQLHLPIAFLIAFFSVFSSCSPEKDNKPGNVKALNRKAPVAMFLSDFHIGENYGGVSREVPQEKLGAYDSVPGLPDMYFHKKISEMLQLLDSTLASHNAESIPYLILLGDIFDVAVHEASDAFNLAHSFFNTPLYNGRSFISFFDTVIYLPGNHDHHVWKMLQEEYYIRERLSQGQEALPFPHRGIKILDLGAGSAIKALDENLIEEMAGGNFISYLLSDNQKAVHISYPNLYISYVNGNQNGGICVTHGHFFEPNWNKDTALVKFFPDVNRMPDYFKNIEKYNAPFTEFSDYSIAQVNDEFTDQLTDAGFQDPSKNIVEEYGRIGLYLAREYPSFFPLDTVAKKLTDVEKLQRHPRQVFPYLQQTQLEMAKNNMSFDQLVYGHTHVPCFRQIRPFKDFAGSNITAEAAWLEKALLIHNTGGWVNISNTDTISMDNARQKAPNPMFMFKNGRIAKVFPDH